MQGVSILLDELKSAEKSLPSEYNKLSELRTFFKEMKSQLKNMKNTNVFMLMTINRVIDFTKAAKGLKLIPKLDPLDLKETLLLPLHCMKNIQDRVQIILLPYSKEPIYNFIISDKQWLQENILCLLSNAVKYSNAGVVTVKVSFFNGGGNPYDSKNRRNHFAKDVEVGEGEGEGEDEDEGSSQETFTAIYETLNNSLSTKSNKAPQSSPPPSEHSDHSKTESSFSWNSWFRNSIRLLTHSTATSSSAPSVNMTTSSAYTLPKRTNQFPIPFSTFRRTQPERNEFLLFEIEDTGIGMSEEAMQSLFSPFSQAQRLAGGTGLGLYSLAQRIETLKGQYGVRKRSDGRQGSLFWFMIPYHPDDTISKISLANDSADQNTSFSNGHFIDLKQTNNSRPLSTFNSFNGLEKVIELETAFDSDNTLNKMKGKDSSLNILLVEDSPVIAKMSLLMLKKLGHRTTLATNGFIGLNCMMDSYELQYNSETELENPQISENFTHAFAPLATNDNIKENSDKGNKTFDLVFMDFQMPVMDGFEATRRYREFEKKRNAERNYLLGSNQEYHLTIIGLTATSDEETIEAGINMGMDDFIMKPLNDEKVISKIMKFQSTFPSLNPPPPWTSLVSNDYTTTIEDL
jgi:CheY-like chemotaxis protein